MSNLTVALAILGGLVLATVVGYNAWMSRRNAPRQPDAPPHTGFDELPPRLSDEEQVLHVEPQPSPGY